VLTLVPKSGHSKSVRMSKASTHPLNIVRARPRTPVIGTSAIVPMLACIYATIVGPLIAFYSGTADIRTAQPGVPQRVFWPVIAAASVILVVRNYSRIGRLAVSPHMICFLAYIAFAGASVLWSFRPEISFTRYMQQIMVLTSIVLPVMFAVRPMDLIRGVFLCFALGAILNVFFVLGNSASEVNKLSGYPGYFLGKNYLGEFAAVALLLSLHETLFPGLRRAVGIVVVIITALLLFFANSKTAIGLAFIAPLLASIVLITRKLTRISPAILLLSIPLCYAVLSKVSGFNMNRVSYIIYGDSTFTGRTIIWDFALYMMQRRPILGWGYQSFWLVGTDAPSVVEAPGFVKIMPNAHNGYYDTMLELGNVGYALLLSFIIATLHAIGRVADRNPRRAWLVLSLALFIIIYNYLESTWMRGSEFLWVVFVVVTVEISRYQQPLPRTCAAHGTRTTRRGSRGPPRSARMARVGIATQPSSVTQSRNESDPKELSA
jgi:exopolysaccharide production protein ExoQ